MRPVLMPECAGVVSIGLQRTITPGNTPALMGNGSIYSAEALSGSVTAPSRRAAAGAKDGDATKRFFSVGGACAVLALPPFPEVVLCPWVDARH